MFLQLNTIIKRLVLLHYLRQSLQTDISTELLSLFVFLIFFYSDSKCKMNFFLFYLQICVSLLEYFRNIGVEN